MNIYFVTRWGNEVLDDCGPDGPDTNFLVRAKSHQNAAALADEALLNYPNNGVRKYCEMITLLGVDAGHDTESVFHGPFISNAFFPNNSNYKYWHRDSDNLEKWVEEE